jgi:carbon-monoxide dehydrogenase small subunit
MKKRILNITVNGVLHEILISPNALLLEVLREDLRLTGTKFGCEHAECGLCTVLVEGVPTLSCIKLASLCDGKSIDTVEGLHGPDADLVKQAFAEEGASQCGYCTPSMALMMTHIVSQNRDVDIRKELSGNICRCTGYVKILKAYERVLELKRR